MKKIVFWLLVGVFISGGCGQMGPLMLPADKNSADTQEKRPPLSKQATH